MSSIALRIEGVNPHVLTMNGIRSMFFPEAKPEEQSCKLWHLLGNCSIENYHQMLKLVIETDLDSYFEVFNVGNEYVHPSIDVQQLIKEYWPDVPNYTKGNEALYSIEKAKKLLGYKPTIPKEYSDYGKQKEQKSETPKPNLLYRIYRYSIHKISKLIK